MPGLVPSQWQDFHGQTNGNPSPPNEDDDSNFPLSDLRLSASAVTPSLKRRRLEDSLHSQPAPSHSSLMSQAISPTQSFTTSFHPSSNQLQAAPARLQSSTADSLRKPSIGRPDTACQCPEQLMLALEELSLFVLRYEAFRRPSAGPGVGATPCDNAKMVGSMGLVETSIGCLQRVLKQTKRMTTCSECLSKSQIQSLGLHVCEKMVNITSDAYDQLDCLRRPPSVNSFADTQPLTERIEDESCLPSTLQESVLVDNVIRIGHVSLTTLDEWATIISSLLQFQAKSLIDLLRRMQAHGSMLSNGLLLNGTGILLKKTRDLTRIHNN